MYAFDVNLLTQQEFNQPTLFQYFITISHLIFVLVFFAGIKLIQFHNGRGEKKRVDNRGIDRGPR